MRLQGIRKKLVVILDQEGNKESSKHALDMDDKVVQPEFVDWVAYFRHASYVITDSLHGACFSIIFGRRFVSLKNRSKADECASKWRKFLEATGLPLREELLWRNSYVAVIDGEAVRIDEKSGKELNINYE